MVLGRCLVEGDPESTASARSRRRKTFGASLAIEILLLALLVAIPLLTSVAQPRLRKDLPPDITFIRGRHDRNPIQHARPTSPEHTRAPIWSEAQEIFNAPRPVHQPEEADGDDRAPDMPGGEVVPGALEAAELNRSAFVPPAHVEPPAHPEKRIVKVSEGVLEAQLISRIEPQYPFIAMETKTEGTVRLHAIISRDGRITFLDVLSGHPLLVKAALDAVRQWRYRPTMLNGEPVEVETSITVIFRLRPR
ncbi:MAG TPA: TonB family protein [Candidatus Acidoferrales bacterium]|nr:TonB family protein [Candidatus Acidoferrales bacterium]